MIAKDLLTNFLDYNNCVLKPTGFEGICPHCLADTSFQPKSGQGYPRHLFYCKECSNFVKISIKSVKRFVDQTGLVGENPIIEIKRINPKRLAKGDAIRKQEDDRCWEIEKEFFEWKKKN